MRFKFKPSVTLTKKIIQDEYLLENLPLKSQAVFEKKNADKCNTKLAQKRKKANEKLVGKSSVVRKEKISEQKTYNHIVNMLKE